MCFLVLFAIRHTYKIFPCLILPQTELSKKNLLQLWYFFEPSNAQKTHSCDRFRSISVGFERLFEHCLQCMRVKFIPPWAFLGQIWPVDRPNFNSMRPRHLKVKVTTISRLSPFNARKIFLVIWPQKTVKWWSVGQIWPCLGQFWTKPNNPNCVFCH